ncbi:MAG: TetR/AcrR family transcriptional regulator [Methanomicrobiales archaeon]|nr:TetR/AcrR family transcriptional regulator [Methanomicrobiales archaeon]
MTQVKNKQSGPKKPAKGQDADAGKSPGNREKILATALRLFTAQGVDSTPTAQISRDAGVSTGTPFHYFPDKKSLIDQLYLSIKKKLAEAIRSHDDETLPTKQRLGQCLRGYVAWGVENPEKMQFLDQMYNSPGLCEEVKCQAYDDFAWMLELGDAAVREGVLPDRPREFQVVMLSRILNGILTLIDSKKSGMSQDEIIENGLAMLWNH